MNRLSIQSATVADLQSLAREGGRIRYRHGELYVRPQRSRNLLNRAAEAVSGLTSTKRLGVMTAIRLICEKNKVDFEQAMRGSGLSADEIRKLENHSGDLKGTHLDKILSRFVQVGDVAFEKGRPLGKGAFGEVFEARNGGESIALKSMMAPTGNTPAVKRAWEQTLRAQRSEVAAHSLAAGVRIDEGAPTYVVPTGNLVHGVDGAVYQPMAKAVGAGDNPIRQQKKRQMTAVLFARKGQGPADPSMIKRMREIGMPLSQRMFAKNSRDDHVTLTVRDWVQGLRQLKAAGIAHRDIKPENFLLSPDGIWQITDFGTSGADNSRFHAEAGKNNFRVTGNSNDMAKSPEWLASESIGAARDFEVGHKADVFSLGVAVFRRLAGGFPFDGTPGAPDEKLLTSAYVANVRAYAESGLSFSDWYAQHTGRSIPALWQAFLNAALHADPQQRLSADDLIALDIFRRDELDDPALRSAMVKQALD
jgi:serine/threonine protein kinase